jgi:1D-myo-inositol-tetrakisphosphate 5-kinase/inositol-polyphosphate multikinase
MGTQTFEPDAPHSKQERETQKYPLQSEFGFRIVGMRVYDSVKKKYTYFDKSYGTKLRCRSDCKKAFEAFFQCKESQPSYSMNATLTDLITALDQIKMWFKYQNTTLSFYASSILMSYEGSLDLHTNAVSMPKPVLKMIDFTHVCRKMGGDPGYIQGIENLLSILLEIADQI